jgi:hypothetical protein
MRPTLGIQAPPYLQVPAHFPFDWHPLQQLWTPFGSHVAPLSQQGVTGARVGEGVTGARVGESVGFFDGLGVTGAEVTGALLGDGVMGCLVGEEVTGAEVIGDLVGLWVIGLDVELPHTMPS